MSLFSKLETKKEKRSTRTNTADPVLLVDFVFPSVVSWVTVKVLATGPTRIIAAYIEKRLLVRHNVSLTVVGAIISIHDKRDPELATIGVDIAAVGSNLQVSVRGLNGSYVDWFVEVEAILH